MPRKTHKLTKLAIATLQYQNPILFGMAKGPWAIWWADREEEKGRSFSGLDIYEESPFPPAAAVKWAEDVASEYIKLNNVRALEDLAQIATRAGFTKDEESFGMYLGCQATGAGISWSDDCPAGSHDLIKAPYREFNI
jgi:hypothetical protein